MRANRSSGGLTAGKSNQVFGYKARTACSSDERATCGSDRTHAMHGRIKMMQRSFARAIRHRPFSGQPVSGLLDRTEFLHIAFRRHDKGQGFPPVDFYQVNSFMEKRTGTFPMCERFRKTGGAGLRRSRP